MKTFKDYLIEASGQKTYFRGTNNPKEDELVKSKELRPSLNHITGKRERGISVSDVPDVGNYFHYMYAITGSEVGEGADGEPLLDPKTIEFVKWIKR
jgi:hypothetical protein